uniref:sulfatase/phosphatase domain-containing protein n=1 Tax=Labilibaculum sp. TaxID=2060723 RepID=UPI003568F912
ENVDYSALFADYANADYPESMQGRSFRKNLVGETPKDWRKYAYYRYWQHETRRPGHFGIRGERYKLAFCYGNGFKDNKYLEGEETGKFWDFYDLQEDPNELHNAYQDPQYQEIIKEMKVELLKQRQEVGDLDEDNPEILDIIAKHWNDKK